MFTEDGRASLELKLEAIKFAIRSDSKNLQDEAIFLCRKCHGLAYRAQQLRAFKKPTEPRGKPQKKKYTEEDWLRKAMAFLRKYALDTNGTAEYAAGPRRSGWWASDRGSLYNQRIKPLSPARD